LGRRLVEKGINPSAFDLGKYVIMEEKPVWCFISEERIQVGVPFHTRVGGKYGCMSVSYMRNIIGISFPIE